MDQDVCGDACVCKPNLFIHVSSQKLGQPAFILDKLDFKSRFSKLACGHSGIRRVQPASL